MKIFIVGVSGAVGGLLAQNLLARRVDVRGLVRREAQEVELTAQGVRVTVGDLARTTVEELAAAFDGADAVVFTAGSNGGAREVTRAIDGEGVTKAVEAARLADVARFVLVSVLPESWREHDNGDEVEYYFAVKKRADNVVSRSDRDWIILRPSLLVDGPRRGTVALGPAELHGDIAREDVADTLAELLHEPRIRRQILELNTGSTPIRAAVQENVRHK